MKATSLPYRRCCFFAFESIKRFVAVALSRPVILQDSQRQTHYSPFINIYLAFDGGTS